MNKLIATFTNLNLGKKLITYFLIVGLIPLTIVGIISLSQGSAALRMQAENQLVSVREMKKAEIESYFTSIINQVVTFSEDRMVIDAMREFAQAFTQVEGEFGASFDENQDRFKSSLMDRYQYQKDNTFGASSNAVSNWYPKNRTTEILQSLYIGENPHPIGAKEELDDANDNTAYSQIHSTYHPIIRSYLQKFGYYDIFLAEPENGTIVYSVFKEVDYATSLMTGPYSATNFAHVFKAARGMQEKDAVALVDFEQYEPSYNAPASFIASPIYDGNEKIGVLLFQMPVDKINEVMTSNGQWANVGLGASGESYLVASDYTMRNNSRFLVEDQAEYMDVLESVGVASEILAKIDASGTSILFQEVETEASQAALRGQSGVAIIDDYRGVPVLSAYTPVDITGLDWAILAEIDESEAFSAIDAMSKIMLIIALVMAAAIVGIAVLITRSLTSPHHQTDGWPRRIG